MSYREFIEARRSIRPTVAQDEEQPWVLPQVVEEDYTTAESTVNRMDMEGDFCRGVEITEDEFYRRVCEAFQRRMEKILPPDRIREAMANPVFGRMVANKYREVANDKDNERLSQKRVLAGHIASLMHSLVLAFG